MLRWSGIFFSIAIIAAIFGFTILTAEPAFIAQIIFFTFIVGFVFTLLYGLKKAGR